MLGPTELLPGTSVHFQLCKEYQEGKSNRMIPCRMCMPIPGIHRIINAHDEGKFNERNPITIAQEWQDKSRALLLTIIASIIETESSDMPRCWIGPLSDA